MGESDWDRLQRLFHGALELRPAHRAAYLDASCGGNKVLRVRLEKMLAAADTEGPVFGALRGPKRRTRPRPDRG